MAARKNDKVLILKIKKGDSLKIIYAKLRRAFTAADLAKCAEIEEGIPFEQVLAEARAIQAEPEKKQKPRAKKKA
jgi:hypothetical protein